MQDILNAVTTQNMVITHGKDLITTSLVVAEVFGRNHRDVVRTIEKLIDGISKEDVLVEKEREAMRIYKRMVGGDAAAKSFGSIPTSGADAARTFTRSIPTNGSDHARKNSRMIDDQTPLKTAETMFREIIYDVTIGKGGTRQEKAYEITQKGFSLLVMGFTGALALRFKLRFLDAFEALEEENKHLTAENIKLKDAHIAMISQQLARSHRHIDQIMVDNGVDRAEARAKIMLPVALEEATAKRLQAEVEAKKEQERLLEALTNIGKQVGFSSIGVACIFDNYRASIVERDELRKSERTLKRQNREFREELAKVYTRVERLEDILAAASTPEF